MTEDEFPPFPNARWTRIVQRHEQRLAKPQPRDASGRFTASKRAKLRDGYSGETLAIVSFAAFVAGWGVACITWAVFCPWP